MSWKLDVKPTDLRLVEASAGSGKTYTLMELVSALVTQENEDAGSILATTFTNKAAGELKQRIRRTLLESDRPDAAQQAVRAANGLVGTVNGVAGQILSDYAIDAGLPPQLEVLPEDAAKLIFQKAVAGVLEVHERKIAPLARQLGFSVVRKDGFDKTPDWRKVVQSIVDRARANGIGADRLADSCQASVAAAKEWFDGSWTMSLQDIVQWIGNYSAELDRTDVGEGTQEYFAKVKEFVKSPTWGGVATVAQAERLGKTDATPFRNVVDTLRQSLCQAKGLRDDVVEMIGWSSTSRQKG